MAGLLGLGREPVYAVKFDRDPVQALDALRADFESFFSRTRQRLDNLQVTVGSQHADNDANGVEGEPAEPPALVSYWNKPKGENQGQDHQKRYVVSCGVKQDSTDIRLNGRWMELSTQRVDTTSVAQAAVRKSKRRISRRGESTNMLDDQSRCKLPLIQPAGRFRLLWDACGLVLIMMDAFVLPVALAWELEGGWQSPGGIVLLLIFWVSVVFWSADVFLNFITAFYRSGKLVSDSPSIVRHYVQTWLVFDVALLTLDFMNAFTEMGELAALRYARIVRAFRLLRLLKMSKLQDILQEIAASTGRQWMMLVIAIVNTSFLILVVAHMLTCCWYWLGRLVEFDGIVSWIEISGATGLPVYVQYLHSLRYVMNAPSPPGISPESEKERLFDIMAYVFSLVVIGSAVSAIAGTLNELKAMNEASARQKREIRLYLTSQSASFELVSRIMKFVDYKLQRMSFVTFDPSLISPTLQTELFVGQRSRYLQVVPIFSLTSVLFPDVFATICAALEKDVYEQKEHVFAAGAWSTALHIAAAGVFNYIEGIEPDGKGVEIAGERWFGELSLYAEKTVHQTTLTAKSFAEMFSLSGSKLADCVRDSPGCTSMFCEYAKEFILASQKKRTTLSADEHEQMSRTCCEQNQYYQILYPDPTKLFANISIAPEVRALFTEEKNPHDALDEWEEFKSEESVDPGLHDLLDTLEEGFDADALPRQLQQHIPELNKTKGSHMVFDQAPERDRAESSCISILALVRDRYDVFVEPQAANAKLRPEQWAELRKIVALIAPTGEHLQAVLVILAIRGLGKNKAVMNQVPREMKRPERAVIYLMKEVTNVVPSVSWLSTEALDVAESALLVHETFNFAQMLQGENVPANLAELHQLVQKKGEHVFHVYMLFLLGFMSGIAGGKGSRFMNARNAEAVIAGFCMIKHILNCQPREIYWGYLTSRARSLQLPSGTPEDLVLIRLACLSRVQDLTTYAVLRASWEALGDRERSVLVDHFLADGIEKRAFVLEFLPACVASAKSNPLLGLTLLMEVLVELLTNLQPAVSASPEVSDVMMLPVDLMDMSEFIAAVQNRFIFQTCVSRCAFRFSMGRVNVEMTGGNWGRSNDPDTDLTSLSYELKDLLVNQQMANRV